MVTVEILVVVANLYGSHPRPPQRNQDTHANVTGQKQATERDAKVWANMQRQKEEEERFIADFVVLPPQERVRIWKSATERKNREKVVFRMQMPMVDALIMQGLDAVPYLAEIARNKKENLYFRFEALRILCDMDRFVPIEESPLPEAGGRVWFKQPGAKGLLNPFMVVDGRRIGKEGYSLIKWAAEQTEDKELRFHARELSGLLEQDLRQLPFDEQIRQWREAIAKSHGEDGEVYSPDRYVLYKTLQKILIEHMPESLTPLTELLEQDSNGYIREGVINILGIIDRDRMRLRATTEGRRSIEAVRRALERGDLRPAYRKREWRKQYWDTLSAQFYKDEFRIDPTSTWALYALAFERFYGEKVMQKNPFAQRPEATPVMRQFVTYLTKIDPFFPSWEYTFFFHRTEEQVLHPRFKQKIARYHEYWRCFTSERRGTGSVSPSPAVRARLSPCDLKTSTPSLESKRDFAEFSTSFWHSRGGQEF